MIDKHLYLLCAAGDCADLRTLRSALQAIAGEALRIEGHHGREGLLLALRAHGDCGDLVPMVAVTNRLADSTGVDTLAEVATRDPASATRKLLIVADEELDSARRAVAAGIVDGVLARGWTRDDLESTVGALAGDYFHDVDPKLGELVFGTWQGRKRGGDSSADAPIGADQRSFLEDRDLSDSEVEAAMIAEMDRVLDHPPRRPIPAGSLILAEGETIDGITIVLDGEVRLFRMVEGREVVFHQLTAGRIIGLMSLARSQPAVFSVEAETDVTVLPVTLEQLDGAIRASPSLAAHFVSVLVRSLARRNLRSIEQQLRIREFAVSRIQESERLAVVGQLAASVAHELNNPLQGIVAYSHLLLERLSEDDEHRSSIEKIVTQADRCIAIVRALLDFSRPVAPKKHLSDVNSLLAECIELVDAQALFLNIEVDRRLDPGLPKVMVDPSQMQEVFVNLIINAAEAMDGSGRLTIVTRHTDHQVEIEVSDTGPGIAREDLERVFDPFFSTKEAGHGTGLGLAISYGIVREHEGSITVSSEPAAGATFVVRLPITANRPWSNGTREE